MDNKHIDPRNDALQRLLREMEEKDLDLLEPPDEIWQGIESTLRNDQDAPAPVVSLDSRRRTPHRGLLATAAAVVATVIGIVAFVALSRDTDQILATATLAHDPTSFDSLGATAAAEATLVSEDGRLTIKLVDAVLPSPGDRTDLEVWLIQPDEHGNVADLISLGVVNPTDPENLQVPNSHDPTIYYVVDISIEPQDGDTSHSGRSILRGPLTNVN